MPTTEHISLGTIQDFMSDLRVLARTLLKRESDADSVRPTALVVSAISRSKRADKEWEQLSWQNRQEFFAEMHRAMRQALVDHARKKKAQRRPPLRFVDPIDIDLYHLPETARDKPDQIVALEEALAWLRLRDPALSEIVQHHYFIGLSVADLVLFLEMSEKTVKRRLAEARLLLHKKILDLLRANVVLR